MEYLSAVAPPAGLELFPTLLGLIQANRPVAHHMALVPYALFSFLKSQMWFYCRDPFQAIAQVKELFVPKKSVAFDPSKILRPSEFVADSNVWHRKFQCHKGE